MKTLAYSEVPKSPTYVHLAYLSASSSSLAAETLLSVGALAGVFALLALVLSSVSKWRLKAPLLWRLALITMVTVSLCLILIALLSLPLATRDL